MPFESDPIDYVEVADFHTYYATEFGLLVHNANCNLKNGDVVPTTKALDAAIKHLGDGYKEIAPGVFKSADGTKVVRMTDKDLDKVNNHYGVPHMNFETGRTVVKPNGKESFDSKQNNHIILEE